MLGAEEEVLGSLNPGERDLLRELLAKVAADIGRPPPEARART